jgi:hypothetical protein
MEIQMLIDMWGLVKAYVNVKERDVVATKFVDIALDNGIAEEELKELIGLDDELDEAVREMLDADEQHNDEYNYSDDYAGELTDDY